MKGNKDARGDDRKSGQVNALRGMTGLNNGWSERIAGLRWKVRRWLSI